MGSNLIDSRRVLRYLPLLVLISVGIPSCISQTIQNTQDVITTIMNGYNKNIRPATEQSEPVVVKLSFELVAIREFVEINEKLSVVGILNMEWVDPRMRWDPSLHNNTEMVTIPMSEVWSPNLILANAVGDIKAIGQNNKWLMVRYHYSGGAFWSPGDILDASCPTDVTYYPFDVQKCRLDFIPWGYLASEVHLVSTETAVGLNFFDENGEWTLTHTKTIAQELDGIFTVFKVHLDIERRPMFFLVNVVLPIIFMGFLNVLVFALPVQSGERVSYAITVLLAIAVFLTIVGDNMPKTSRPMSTISYFLLITLILSACICLATIVNLKIYYHDEEAHVPKFIAWVTRKIVCKREPKMTKIQDISQQLELTDVNISSKESEMKKTWADSVITAQDDDVVNNPVTWRDVSRAADRVFGTMAFLLLVTASVSFIVLVATRDVSLRSVSEESD